MSNPAPVPDPPLRERFPLYPAQFFSAVAMISLGPLLDSMMRDLAIPLDQGGLVSVGWQSGVASSMFALSGGVGSMLFPYLVGPIADSAGFRAALAVTAFPAAAYGLFSLLIHARAAKNG